LLKRYEYVLIQEEQIWRIISRLKQNLETLIPVERYKATTEVCSRCGSRKEDIRLSDRTYKCSNCGLTIDRDLNSAINILKMGLNKVEKTTISTSIRSNPYTRVSYTSVKQEVTGLMEILLYGRL